ncbi:hypothetical protein [Ferrimonas sp. YFM]|uniref:hypothetical protein n=1 Tax=Ferrimonas sp. YFM TaxID=3028878 RepID=UPI002574091E|nr:hypothetical protein [Ferrimonas sp. YFM]BDY05396.1 hypothetical protein F0521_24370 [Ferrimonas sp. YFM]
MLRYEMNASGELLVSRGSQIHVDGHCINAEEVEAYMKASGLANPTQAVQAVLGVSAVAISYSGEPQVSQERYHSEQEVVLGGL